GAGENDSVFGCSERKLDRHQRYRVCLAAEPVVRSDLHCTAPVTSSRQVNHGLVNQQLRGHFEYHSLLTRCLTHGWTSLLKLDAPGWRHLDCAAFGSGQDD